MYDYKTERPNLFTEDGVEKFIKIRDRVQGLLNASGAVRMGEAISGTFGDSWQSLACVDRLVEIGEIREVTDKESVRSQDRVFVADK